MSRIACCMALLALMAVSASAKCGTITCEPGWVCVNGACAKPCPKPGYWNNLKGLCSGGPIPYTGVFCNSVEGRSDLSVYEVPRFNVLGFVCKTNACCNQFGPGYFCNYFTPNSDKKHQHGDPMCSRPAPPACFPILPVESNWPKCNSTITCPP